MPPLTQEERQQPAMVRRSNCLLRAEAPALVGELIRLATRAESEAVLVAAIKEMFDRGFGKADLF